MTKIQERTENLFPDDVPKIDAGRFLLIQQGIVKPTSREYHMIYNADRRRVYSEAKQVGLTSKEARKIRSFDPREQAGSMGVFKKVTPAMIRQAAKKLRLDPVADVFKIYKAIMEGLVELE